MSDPGLGEVGKEEAMGEDSTAATVKASAGMALENLILVGERIGMER